MKKIISIIITMFLLATLFAGCKAEEKVTETESTQGSTEQASTEAATTEASTEATTEATTDEQAAPTETYTIAVAWNAIDATTQIRTDYLQNHLGPALGLEFIFSEAIADTGAMMTFLENSYAAGADALLSNVTDGIEQIAARCDELGIYTAFVTSKYSEEIANIPTYMGISGVDITKVGDAYGMLMNEALDPAQPSNFLIITGGAAMGVRSHLEASASMISQIGEMYGLTYDQEASELAALNATTDINTGRDVKITVVPGFPNMEGYVSGVSGLLQTGDYDVMLSVYPTTETFSTAIDEVEKALGKNIKVLSQMNFGDSTKLAFETLDSTGNPTLDGAVLYAGTAQDAFAIVMLYNGLSGNSDLIKPEGKATIMAPGALVCASPEDYKVLSLLDTSDDTYVYTADEIKQMLAAFNTEVTTDDLMNVVNSFSTQDILARRMLGN